MNFRSIILASINTSSKMSILYLAFEESTPNFYARKRLSYIEPVLRLVNYRLGERKFKAKFCLRPAETKSKSSIQRRFQILLSQRTVQQLVVVLFPKPLFLSYKNFTLCIHFQASVAKVCDEIPSHNYLLISQLHTSFSVLSR